MKDTYFFSHDYNSRSDSKIKKLLSKHGFLGYGLFWAIIEDLYNNANALPTDYDSIAFDLRSDSVIIKSIVEDFGLFVSENGFFGSESVNRRLELRNEKSSKASMSAHIMWKKKREKDANAVQSHSESVDEVNNRNAIKDSIGKETKGQKNDRTPQDTTGNHTKVHASNTVHEDDPLPF